jgi:hypothetical protein
MLRDEVEAAGFKLVAEGNFWRNASDPRDLSYRRGIAAPKKTSMEMIEKLNKEINATLADAKFKSRLADMGATALASSPAAFGKLSRVDQVAAGSLRKRTRAAGVTTLRAIAGAARERGNEVEPAPPSAWASRHRVDHARSRYSVGVCWQPSPPAVRSRPSKIIGGVESPPPSGALYGRCCGAILSWRRTVSRIFGVGGAALLSVS